MKIDDFGHNVLNWDAAREQIVLLSYVYANNKDGFVKALGTGGTLLYFTGQSKSWPVSFAISLTPGGNFLVNVAGSVDMQEYIAQGGGLFLTDWQYGTAKVVEPFLEQAQEIETQFVKLGLTVTAATILRVSGWGFGAAVAELFGMLIDDDFKTPPVVQEMLFSPPVVFTRGTVGNLPDEVFNIVSTNDLTPDPPPFTEVPIANNAGGFDTLVVPAGGWIPDASIHTLWPSGDANHKEAPTNPPAGWSDTWPGASFIPNYWARLYLMQTLSGGALPTDITLEEIQRAVAAAGNVQANPSLPPTATTAAGRQIPIPPATFVGSPFPQVVFQVAGPTNGMAKHVWRFTGENGETWSETFYINVGSDQSRAALIASLPSKTSSLVTNRLAMLWTGHDLTSITASYVVGLRQAARLAYNLNGTGESYIAGQGPELVAKACVWDLGATGGSRRKIWIRGIPAGAVISNAATGEWTHVPDFKLKILAWLAAVTAAPPYCIFNRQPKPAGINLNPITVASVDGTISPPWALVTTNMAHGLTGSGQCILYGASPKDAPGLVGVFSYAVATTAPTLNFWIPYITPAGAKLAFNLGAVRPYNVNALDPISVPLCSLFGVNAHKTRNPQVNARGDKRPVRIRNKS